MSYLSVEHNPHHHPPRPNCYTTEAWAGVKAARINRSYSLSRPEPYVGMNFSKSEPAWTILLCAAARNLLFSHPFIKWPTFIWNSWLLLQRTWTEMFSCCSTCAENTCLKCRWETNASQSLAATDSPTKAVSNKAHKKLLASKVHQHSTWSLNASHIKMFSNLITASVCSFAAAFDHNTWSPSED